MVRARLAVLAAALALAGCGGSSAEPEQPARPAARSGADAEVRALFAAWQRALRAGDAKTACTELISADVQRRVEELGGSCERVLLDERIAEAGPQYRLEVLKLQVSGSAGKAQIRESGRDGTSVREQPVVRERGRWRLAA